jgi:AhpD family alkylhydroperoxidase
MQKVVGSNPISRFAAVPDQDWLRVSHPRGGRCLHARQATIGGNMASGTRIPKTELTGIYGGLVKLMSRRMFGKVPEGAEVMWHHPRLFKDMMGLGRKAEKWDRLDPDLASLASMATASLIGCSACLDLHYFMAHNKGLDEAKAREVPRWRESSAFTALERRAMEYAEAVSQTPPIVTDEMSAALLEDLGPAALLELTSRIGLMNAAARPNIALGIQSEGFAATCGLPPLATPSQVVSAA